MAEERIICLQIGSHLRNCPLMKKSGYCILDCGCDQLEGIKCNKGFTRSQAVERMARAMAADDMPVEGYKVLAEAALDALVGKNFSALDKLNKVN